MTGKTSENIPLIGGVWRLYHQEGFPLEMSHLIAKGNGWKVDWLEAMADASLDNNCPALMKQIESFLDDETIDNLKIGYMFVFKHLNKTFQEVLDEKRKS